MMVVANVLYEKSVFFKYFKGYTTKGCLFAVNQVCPTEIAYWAKN